MSNADLVQKLPNADLVQKHAASPMLSAFVAAHAGSGKTKTLTRRVLRLLLAGTPAGSILCLTYTKTAAATMANRVFEALNALVSLDDADLKALLLKDYFDANEVITDEKLAFARRLFANALETPGGLKVQTIHAFCGRVLRQFPLEAGIPADFEELDDEAKARLLEESKAAVLKNDTLHETLVFLSENTSDFTLTKLLNEAVYRKTHLLNWFDENQRSFPLLFENLYTAMNLRGSLEALENSLIEEMVVPQNEWIELAEAMSQMPKMGASDKNIYEVFSSEAFDEEAYRLLFLKKEYEPRAKIFTVDLSKPFPELCERLLEERERLVELYEQIHLHKIYEKTKAFLHYAILVLERYEALKQKHSYLDFDDLIEKTHYLLALSSGALWVQYKLDASIDHILVDEAQDTAPMQWAIVERLVDSFLHGNSARELKRTLFVVGDEKQSIYSFQGADPAKMAEMLAKFSILFKENKQDFEKITLDTSFRSSQSILSFTDKALQNERMQAGFIDKDIAPHQAFKTHIKGYVELWELETQPVVEEVDYKAPVDAPLNNVMMLAEKIALKIHLMISKGEILPHLNRAIEPRDILILVTKRNALYQAMIKALKIKGIAVAGADRLSLTDHIAILDLLNLAECLLNSHDDLALATLLKSPFFNYSEDDIFKLCFGREGTVLEALRAQNLTIYQKLVSWQKKALTLSPFDFYAHILTLEQQRVCFIARFGQEVEDVLEAFMNEAKSFGEGVLPSLRHFTPYLREKASDIKRDMELSRNEVRVMTVHGAKGLESEIVFLANSSQTSGKNDSQLLFLPLDSVSKVTRAPLVWVGGAALPPLFLEVKEALKVKAQEESQRLLYVALTRAISRLYLCGLDGTRIGKEHWYATLSTLFEGVEAHEDAVFGKIKRWSNETIEAPRYDVGNKNALESFTLPAFVLENVPFVAPVYRNEKADTEEQTFGKIVHKLLEFLPAIAMEKREKSARDFLSKAVEEGAEAILNETFNVLNMPFLQRFFGENSYAEVAIGDNRLDRILIEEGVVTILDYKTGEMNDKILAQMRDYYNAVKQAFPQNHIKIIIVFTHPLKLINLEQKDLTV